MFAVKLHFSESSCQLDPALLGSSPSLSFSGAIRSLVSSFFRSAGSMRSPVTMYTTRSPMLHEWSAILSRYLATRM